MEDKIRFWKTAIMSVILASFVSLVTYKVIAGTLTVASACPPSGTCPSTMNFSPPPAEVKMQCTVKDASDTEACKMLSDDQSSRACPFGHLGNKP